VKEVERNRCAEPRLLHKQVREAKTFCAFDRSVCPVDSSFWCEVLPSYTATAGLSPNMPVLVSSAGQGILFRKCRFFARVATAGGTVHQTDDSYQGADYPGTPGCLVVSVRRGRTSLDSKDVLHHILVVGRIVSFPVGKGDGLTEWRTCQYGFFSVRTVRNIHEP
jgi:hypothetical protein